MNNEAPRSKSAPRAAKLWLLAIPVALAAVSWFQYAAAVHAGARFEAALVQESTARGQTLTRHAKKIAKVVGVEPRPEVVWAIGNALQAPTPDGVSDAAPVAHALLVHTAVASSDVIETVMPLVNEARQAISDDVARARRVRDAYQEALDSKWSGMWLRWAGYPRHPIESYPS
ncbi:hypothetical protein ACOTC5_29870 [Achromobacter xylosoxidans]